MTIAAKFFSLVMVVGITVSQKGSLTKISSFPKGRYIGRHQ